MTGLKKLTGQWPILYLLVFLVLAGIGFTLILYLEDNVRQQAKARFINDAKGDLAAFEASLSARSEQFRAFAELPSFLSLRFHVLTLDSAARSEDIRHLELYAFKLIKRQPELLGIRFIDNNGTEIFKVDREGISQNLSDASQSGDFQAALQLNAGQLRIITDQRKGMLTWWVPVFTSESLRLGVLSFNVAFDALSQALADLSTAGFTVALLEDTQGKLIAQSGLNPGENPPLDTEWRVKRELRLPGLAWTASVQGKPTLLHGALTLHRVLIFGLLFLTAALLAGLSVLTLRRLKAERKVQYLAYFDALTGLFNRNQFEDRLAQTIEHARQWDTHHALLYLDLDQFKVVNDTCGHLAGDQLLQQLSSLLKQKIREGDTLARMGGDEFALLLENCQPDQAQLIANELLKTIADFHFIWNGKSFGLSASIGIALIGRNSINNENALSRADMACNMAKELGRNRIQIYTDDNAALAQRHGEMQWVSRLKKALNEDLFFLEFQHIMPLQTQAESRVRLEALVRIREHGRTIPPGAFIPAAERYDLMPQIDCWVIEAACTALNQMRQVNRYAGQQVMLFINLSGKSISEPGFAKFVQDAMQKHGIGPGSLCFEITETAAISDLAKAIEFMNQVKNLGCELALDDFGTGLCSFSYLKTIPANYLKIDGGFVQSMRNDPMDCAIIEAVKRISDVTSLQTIAEFVEDDTTLQLLRELGVNYAQGYGIHSPQPLDTLLASQA